jgi:hypothetical protein
MVPFFLSCEGLTVGHLLNTAEEKAAIGRRYQAQAADMESFDILAAMETRSVPALVLRSISDGVDQVMPDFERAIDARGRIDPMRSLGVFLSEPGRTLRLARSARLAGRSLETALRRLLSGFSSELV